MRRNEPPYSGRQFILNKATGEIHDLDRETPECGIDGIRPDDIFSCDTYAEAAQWDAKAKDLAERFIKNFKKFEGNEAGKKLVAAGPKL